MGQTKYAYVKNGVVHSTFWTSGTAKDFPDICDSLHAIPDNITDNDLFIKGQFYKKPDPVQVTARDGEVIYIVPDVVVDAKGVPWAQIATGILTATLGALVQYVIK